ncbi:MAG: 2-oxo acid dehydrogenase subunit E2 [Chloroflexi bacterium]|nr:2-oxo acid dehydrogenase subunit E2 [Chloroflexota bacterium]
MATNVVMPQLGESVVEGTVGKWFKNVGDTIEQYESIMEVVTDKVTSEIPSPASGTILQIITPEGVTVKAGTVVAIIGAPGEVVASGAAVQPPQPQAVAREATIKPTNQPTIQRLTPVVARMIAEHNLTAAELATIQGSGEGGRISKKDIEQFVAQRKIAPASRELPAWEQPGTGELFRPTEEVFKKPSAPTPHPERSVAEAKDAREEIVPVSPMRRAIAEHMVRSKAIAPHVTSVHEVDMSRVIAYQKNHEPEFAKQGIKLTYTAFLVQAAVAALKAFPIVNATYTEQGIVMKRIGIAVAIEDGLIVPVIKHADEKSLLGIARAVNDLATRARDKKLSPDDVAGGTVTITSFGIFGALWGMPIINQPQSAILGVGAIQKRPVVINDAIAIRPMCYLSITIDHRLLDGAIGDQFMQKLNRVLETYPD